MICANRKERKGLQVSPFLRNMAIIREMLERVRSVNLTSEGAAALEATKQQYIDANREQAMSGKTNTGEYISPSYLEDPYFKTREAAERYSRWKDRITPHPDRPPGTPNLFITGEYQMGWDIRITGGRIEHTGYSPLTASVEAKFKNIRGLSPDSLRKYKISYFNPELIYRIKQIIYGM